MSFCFYRKTTEDNQSALIQYKLAKPDAAPSLEHPVDSELGLLDVEAVGPGPDKKKGKRWGVSTGGDGLVLGHEENLASSKGRRGMDRGIWRR